MGVLFADRDGEVATRDDVLRSKGRGADLGLGVVGCRFAHEGKEAIKDSALPWPAEIVEVDSEDELLDSGLSGIFKEATSSGENILVSRGALKNAGRGGGE